MAIITRVTAGDVIRAFTLRNSVVVTGAAGTYYLQMINAYYRFPTGGAMTVFTHVRGIDVTGPLAFGCRAVVATGTVRSGQVVIKICRRPGKRRVTVLTIVTADNVAGMFTGGSTAVVTSSARTLHLEVVDPPYGRPGGFKMTILALVGGAHMVRRNRCRPDQPCLRVTGGALPRGTLEYAPGMAAAAIDVTM